MAREKMWLESIPQKGKEYLDVPPETRQDLPERQPDRYLHRRQLRTGHGYFNNYLNRIIDDRGCSCSGTPPQAPVHFILQCPHHAKARMIMWRETPKIPKLRIDLPLHTNIGAEALAKYLKTTKVATRQWKLGNDNKPTNPTSATGWDTLDQPQGEHLDGSSSGETGDEAEEEDGGE